VELAPRTSAPLHATGAVEFVPVAAVAGDATFRLREPAGVAALAGSIARLGQLVPVELRPLPGAEGAGGPRFQVVAGFRRLAAVRLLGRERVLARVHARLDDEDAWSLALAEALLGEPYGAADLEALRARLAARWLATWAQEQVDEALVRAPVAPELRERFLAFLQRGASAGGGQGEDGGAAEAVAEDEDQASDRAAVEGGEGAAPDGGGEPGRVGQADAATPEDAAAPDALLVQGRSPAAQGGEERDAADEQGAVELSPEELTEELATRMWELNQDVSAAVDAWDELPAEGRRLVLEQARYMAELHSYLSGRRP
jgi:ParB-like chromosome segregation protein Spo0J